MTRRERMTRTMMGKPVDRPAVNFYELNGLTENPGDPDPFNVFNHPSWKPLLDLTRDRTDRIVIGKIPYPDGPWFPFYGDMKWEHTMVNGSLFTTGILEAGGNKFTMRQRRDPQVNTVWTLEHLLKDEEDLKKWLELPWKDFGRKPDVSGFLEMEKKLGDTGIVMVDMADPLCGASELFDMADFTCVAFGEKELFHRALERFAAVVQERTEAVARALPGRLWRIPGPEYATPPYLPPALFEEFVVRYDAPMVEAIHKTGGWARIHSHGKIHDVLPHIIATGVDGIDPVEPPPQGDVELSYARENFGKQLVLFGNIEITDIENLPADEFEKKVASALRQGTAGEGRGFVLQPSACPLGREVSPRTMRNYGIMVEMTEKFGG